MIRKITPSFGRINFNTWARIGVDVETIAIINLRENNMFKILMQDVFKESLK